MKITIAILIFSQYTTQNVFGQNKSQGEKDPQIQQSKEPKYEEDTFSNLPVYLFNVSDVKPPSKLVKRGTNPADEIMVHMEEANSGAEARGDGLHQSEGISGLVPHGYTSDVSEAHHVRILTGPPPYNGGFGNGRQFQGMGSPERHGGPYRALGGHSDGISHRMEEFGFDGARPNSNMMERKGGNFAADMKNTGPGNYYRPQVPFAPTSSGNIGPPDNYYEPHGGPYETLGRHPDAIAHRMGEFGNMMEMNSGNLPGASVEMKNTGTGNYYRPQVPFAPMSSGNIEPAGPYNSPQQRPDEMGPGHLHPEQRSFDDWEANMGQQTFAGEQNEPMPGQYYKKLTEKPVTRLLKPIRRLFGLPSLGLRGGGDVSLNLGIGGKTALAKAAEAHNAALEAPPQQTMMMHMPMMYPYNMYGHPPPMIPPPGGPMYMPGLGPPPYNMPPQDGMMPPQTQHQSEEPEPESGGLISELISGVSNMIPIIGK